MVCLLIKCAQSFSINYQNIFLVLSVNGLIPDPKTFCARVDGRAYIKALAFVEDYSVKKVTFASSIKSCNGYDTQGRCYVG